MAQDQVFNDDANYTSSVNRVIRDDCFHADALFNKEEGTAFERSLNEESPYCYDGACCGDRPPECCRNREHISAVMKDHYPRVTFYRKYQREERGGEENEEVLEEFEYDTDEEDEDGNELLTN